MLNELLAILDVVDRVLKKRKVNTEQRIRDKVLVAIYKLGNEGSQAVTPCSIRDRRWILEAANL